MVQISVDPAQIRNEIAVLQQITGGHQALLTLVDCFESRNNVYLVTELACGGDLFDRIDGKGPYSDVAAADLLRVVLSAVSFLHDRSIVHRDLKPENILFRAKGDDTNLLVADFGLAKFTPAHSIPVLSGFCGTLAYMAPEMLTNGGHAQPV